MKMFFMKTLTKTKTFIVFKAKILAENLSGFGFEEERFAFIDEDGDPKFFPSIEYLAEELFEVEVAEYRKCRGNCRIIFQKEMGFSFDRKTGEVLSLNLPILDCDILKFSSEYIFLRTYFSLLRACNE